MLPLEDIQQRYKERTPQFLNRRALASVLIPLIEIEGEWHLLLEQRNRHMHAQPGEICFPGGTVEPGESPLEAALREAQEEIGLDPQDVTILGEGDILNNADLWIYSFVGVVHTPFQELTLSQGEVDHVFTMPLQWFLENEPDAYTVYMNPTPPEDFPYEEMQQSPDYPWHKSRYKVYVYHYEGVPLWGITAKIVKGFVDTLKE